MDSGRGLRIAIWVAAGLFVLMGGYLVVDSTGPDQKSYGTIISTRFVEGITSHIDVKVGDVTVPVHTEIPGAWIALVESPVLGRIEVAVDGNTLRAGQRVNLKYHVGRLSGQPEVVGLRLESEPFGEH
jgi:hypothetical protein